jgi:hypothetical protein
MRNMLPLTLGVCLAGCATSSGILPAGPNTYTLREHYAPVRGGASAAQQDALTSANAFCTQQGRQFVPTLMNASGSNPYGQTDYSVTFMCLPPDDPRVKNFQIQQAPNLVIEERNR